MDTYLEKVAVSVAEAKEKLRCIKAEDSLVFAVFSDLHTEDVDHKYMKRLILALGMITEEIDYDAVINLGDNFSMLGRDIHITNDELKARFESVLSAMYDVTKHPIINVNGNHDALGTDFFKPDFWNGIVKGKYGNNFSVYGDEGSYYYIDYENANTRLIALSLPHDSDIESEMPAPLWAFGKSQLKWLKETALNTHKDVIIVSHVPFYDKYTGDENATLAVWTGKEEKTSYISALCGWIEDLDEAVAIIDEFNSNSAKVVACLSGHTHCDSLWLPHEEKCGTKNPLPCHQIVTTAACFTENVELEIGINIDIAVWTPSRRELNIIRIGDGEDRKISL